MTVWVTLNHTFIRFFNWHKENLFYFLYFPTTAINLIHIFSPLFSLRFSQFGSRWIYTTKRKHDDLRACDKSTTLSIQFICNFSQVECKGNCVDGFFKDKMHLQLYIRANGIFIESWMNCAFADISNYTCIINSLQWK